MARPPVYVTQKQFNDSKKQFEKNFRELDRKLNSLQKAFAKSLRPVLRAKPAKKSRIGAKKTNGVFTEPALQ